MSGSLRYITAFLTILVVLTLNNVSARETLDMTISANILNNPCIIEMSSATVLLPDIDEATLAASVLTPTDYGSDVSFMVDVKDCEDDTLTALNLSFHPKNGTFPPGFNQVFNNDISASNQGAMGVGVVIFYHGSQENVLKSDGSSNVIIPATQSDYKKSYQFDARYQKIGSVSVGPVAATLTINVTYQ